jgi:hypothetical protein
MRVSCYKFEVSVSLYVVQISVFHGYFIITIWIYW